MRQRILGALCAGIVAGPINHAAAQTVRPATVVQLGGSLVDGQKIPLANSKFESSSGGHSWDVLVEHTVNGQPGLLRVITIKRGETISVDTTVMLRKTLAPVWRHSHGPTRTLLLNFDGNRITGEDRNNGRVDTVNVTAAMPVFDAFSADLALAALDLKKGLHVRLPVYHPTFGFTWLDATVGEPQPMPMSEAAWPLEITEGPLKMRWFVDVRSREQLGAINTLPNGAELRVTRQP